MTEAKFVNDFYYSLFDEYSDVCCSFESLHAIRSIIDYCCTWAEEGSAKKVAYWLRYGIINNCDYSEVRKIANNVEYEVIQYEDLVRIFNDFVKRAKKRGFIKASRIKR